MTQELSVIIPAAGMGRRMKSYGPKPLIELSENHTVIGRQIDIIKRVYPHAEIIVVVGYEADSVMNALDSSITSVENENFSTTNVVRSIGMGLRAAKHNNVLIVYGDLVFNAPAVSVTNNFNYSVAVIDTKGRIHDDEVGLTIVDGRITTFSYDLPTKWGQIIYLTGQELKIFKSIVWNRNNNRWFGFEALNKVIEHGGSIRGIEPKNMKLAEIDTSYDIEKARKI